MTRILIADDSIVFRRFMNEIISSLDGCSVVGQAFNGRAALQKIEELEPDILTLDMEMPEMDGIQVLQALRSSIKKPPSVIVVSSLTERGGSLTLKALQLGAFDFITKPQTGAVETAKAELKKALEPRIRALSLRYNVRNILQRKPALVTIDDSGVTGNQTLHRVNETLPKPDNSKISNGNGSLIADRATAVDMAPIVPDRLPIPKIKPEMVVIGVSTGGPNALASLIPALPDALGVPVFIVQHMPPLFTQSLALSLEKKSALTVVEAENNSTAKPNCVYIAPGGKQMRILPDSRGSITIQTTDDPPENNCRPSVDYLFRSVSQSFPGRALSVILTGMGNDGTLGVRLLKRTGCLSLVQDETSCVVYGMPKSVADAGLADAILPLNRLAETITRIVKK